jgi:hypothetical protein
MNYGEPYINIRGKNKLRGKERGRDFAQFRTLLFGQRHYTHIHALSRSSIKWPTFFTFFFGRQ